MYIEQLYTNCLAEAAYFIESEGEAAVIDPMRNPAPYLQKAAELNADIKYIFETHFHADFVSGHVELAEKSGASIVFGPTAKPSYPIHEGRDGEVFKLGRIEIKLLHTPGHTMESSVFLLRDENGQDTAIFTGDTLFIGDVGRPDLAVSSAVSEMDLAGFLYDSLTQKILPLHDDVVIYPAHGAGSACGRKMSRERFARLGDQRKLNYALNTSSKDEFIKLVTEGQSQPPRYFPFNAALNKQMNESFETLLKRSGKALTTSEFKIHMESGALVIDTRFTTEYLSQTIPGSLFIGLEDQYASWAGTLLPDLHQPILLLTNEGKQEEAIERLARVGFDNVLGFLQGGIEAWINAGFSTSKIENQSASDFLSHFNPENVLDVRTLPEFQKRHLPGVRNLPLAHLQENFEQLNDTKTVFVHCQSGYRSVIASSLLSRNGFHPINIEGGMNALRAAHAPLESENSIS